MTFGPAPVPLATNAVQIDLLTISVTHTWNGMESGGTYFIGSATTSPGADLLGPADQASLDLGAVEVHGHFRPFGARPLSLRAGRRSP